MRLKYMEMSCVGGKREGGSMAREAFWDDPCAA
jgi:hypothetical protein